MPLATNLTDSPNRMTIDPRAYRRALSSFATGIAVVTTLDSEGAQIGITINSFSSVSLDPPLVLWSIAKDAGSYDDFIATEHFAVNILGKHQEHLCERFARPGAEKFGSIEFNSGVGGVPLLTDFAACFACSVEHRYDGGDHTIIVGRVLEFEDRETDPLIFYRGHFLE